MAGGYNMFEKSSGRESSNQIKCAKCGKPFSPKQSWQKICYQCFSASKQSFSSSNPQIPDELLLKNYHDANGILLKEVFISIPERLASLFASDMPPLATKQLRDFHLTISRARNTAILKGINTVKQDLYKCQRDITYQLKREVIPKSFSQFMEHHLTLSEKDEKSLDGFCQHLESIIAYFPKEKGG